MISELRASVTTMFKLKGMSPCHIRRSEHCWSDLNATIMENYLISPKLILDI